LRSAVGHFQDVPIGIEEEELLDASLCGRVFFVEDLFLVEELLDGADIIRDKGNVIHSTNKR
jgi:hypothetical protein